MIYLLNMLLLLLSVGDVNDNSKVVTESTEISVQTEQIKPCGSTILKSVSASTAEIGCPESNDICAIFWVIGAIGGMGDIEFGDPITVIATPL